MNTVKSNGASTTLFQHDRPNNPNRSKFDLSRLTNFSIDTGMIVPFDCFPTLPDDVITVNTKMAMDTLPLIQSSLTNYKVLIHWYYCKSRDLWKGFKTFITKGRTGNVELEIPKVDLSVPLASGQLSIEEWLKIDTDFSYSTSTPFQGDILPKSKHSLSAFLGVPSDVDGIYHGADNASLALYEDFKPYTLKLTSKGIQSIDVDKYNEKIDTGFNSYDKVNALPFVMYQSICKHNYVNQNLLQGNTALFPVEGDDDWLLPYIIENENNVVNYISGRAELESTDVVNYNGVYSNDETDVDLRLLRYSIFDDDYFTTGLPWLQRGDVQTLDAEVSADIDSELTATLETAIGDFDLKGAVSGEYVGSSVTMGHSFEPTTGQVEKAVRPDSISTGTKLGVRVSLDGDSIAKTLNIMSTMDNAKVLITANTIRNLLAMQVWQERNARVDGSYNRMIFQHWATNPHSEEHLPLYIGGTAEYINFSTVLQNSQSTSDSPLGSTAGFGSLSGQDSIGTFHCPDYGYVMGIMIVKPNTVYQQGVEHYLSAESVFDDYIQPEFESLSPQAIFNKEIFVCDNDSDNDDLFCYQERNTSYKVRQNVNRGLFCCKPDKDILFGAFTQARWFAEKPIFSYQFLCMSPENIRRDWLAYPVYPAFRCQLLSEVFITRSLSYSSVPNTFGF